MVEPGRSVMNDVAACADSVRNGEVALPVVDAGEPGDTTVVGVAKTGGMPTIADMETTGTGGVPGAICPVRGEQVTTVPGVVGSEASGTGASVVSGAPGWVVAENGLGPLSGEVTIVPGVDESARAVVPIVETCAKLASDPPSRTTATNSKSRIGSSAPV
jgi:hypothetical protein